MSRVGDAPGSSAAAVLLVTVFLTPSLALAEAAAGPSAANPFGRKYPPRIYETRRLQGKPPTIDGRFDDEAWAQGDWAGGYTQQIPTEGASPSQPTELKILYDDRYLYMAVRVHDDPAKVHRYPGRRDAFTGDIVGICFDSYNDKRTGFEFDLTAGGSKLDLILGNGETEWDTTWDAVWDGEVAHDERGWNAEFRIPFNQLRYGPQDEQVWGLHAWRWIDRLQEEDQWQLIPRQNTGRMYQLGELRGLRGLGQSRHLELLPHVVAEASAGPSVSEAGTEAAGSLGLDAKASVSSNFTLDAAVNPDFGQVEADPSVVNLTAYETFYEEKRPFFLEGRKILSFGIVDADQLFYSRRIGAAPSWSPPLEEGESASIPESTTILGAFKVTGKTNGGLSVGVLQAFTQKESARIASPSGGRDVMLEPFGSFTVARLHKDWDKGTTSVGGMLTSTHRFGEGPVGALLPTQATSGGIDFTRYIARRTWLIEAAGVVSRVAGGRASILALQMDPVHYYQRPDARHLAVDPGRTSLGGHGGSLSFGRSQASRLRIRDQFHWYSPGLDLNEAGYLRQADLKANEARLGWSEPRPKGPFRNYSLEVTRADEWDFGGRKTRSKSQADASAQFDNKWQAALGLSYQDVVDTRMLRGGPALRWHDYVEASFDGQTDPSRHASVELHAQGARARDDDSRSSALSGRLNLRLSNRVSLSAAVSRERLTDNLQYVATARPEGGDRFVLGRIDQDTWSVTFRANVAITPVLTVQYYGSPFLGTGRYSAFKKATDTLAQAHAARFHLYGADEIAYMAAANAYRVTESGEGLSYSFGNPDFSFRQFRSNLVARWEWKPGSSLFVVWSQGRTSGIPAGEGTFSSNWDALWRQRPDNVLLVKLAYWFSP